MTEAYKRMEATLRGMAVAMRQAASDAPMALTATEAAVRAAEAERETERVATATGGTREGCSEETAEEATEEARSTRWWTMCNTHPFLQE